MTAVATTVSTRSRTITTTTTMAPAKTPHNARGRKRDESKLHLEDVGNKGRYDGPDAPRV